MQFRFCEGQLVRTNFGGAYLFLCVSKKRSPVCRSVIGSDHRAGSDEKHEDQRRANTTARQQQCMLWLLRMLASVQVNQAMQELTGANYNTEGEQNEVMSKTRQARHWKETLAVIQYLQEQNPFSNHPSLRNIVTEVHARRPSTLSWSCDTEVDGGGNK